MKTLRFTNKANTFNQSYIVDLIGDSEELTVYQAKYIDSDGQVQVGLNEDAIKQGFFPYPDIDEYNINEMIVWAETNNYTLVVEEEGEEDVTENTATTFAYSDPTLDNAVNNEAYEADLTDGIAGGNGLITFELDDTSDDLPDGMYLTAQGILAGTPTDEAGDFNLVFAITDGLGEELTSGTIILTLEAGA